MLNQTDDLRKRMASTVSKAKVDESTIDALMTLPGVGRVLAKRIVAVYGDDSVTIVQQDPYRLICDVTGIGFKTADTIALSMDFPFDAPSRVDAGVLHSIDQLCDRKGHCYTDRSSLNHEATKLLGVEVGESIDRLVAANRVVVEVVDGAEVIYTWLSHSTEETVAKLLASILSTEPRPMKRDLCDAAREAIDKFATRAGYSLSESQAEAVQAAAQNKILIITGGPGVGKTSILRAIVDALKLGGLRYDLAAPTGRAAKRMAESTGANAKTIHRLLGLKPGKKPDFSVTNPLPVDALVIDEMSMVDLSLFRKVLEGTPATARLILIGDVDQLPSIGPGAVLRDSVESGALPVARLSQVFRQAKGSKISVAAQAINSGTSPTGDKGKGGEFYIFAERQPASAADTVVDLVTRKLPLMFQLNPMSDIQVLCPAKGGADGTDALNKRLQDAVNPGTEHLFGFRVGDKVIHVDKNDYQKEVMNGDCGRVARIGVNACNVTTLYVTYGDREVEYDKNDICYLKLSYAITIHKSQGGEFKAVVIPMLGPDIMLSKHLLYTAVTRGKGLVVVVSNDAAIRRALSETKREKRNTRLADRIRYLVAQ